MSPEAPAPFASSLEAVTTAIRLVGDLIELRRQRREADAANGHARWSAAREELQAALVASEGAGQRMRLLELQRTFSLTDVELDLLLLALAPLVDPEFLDRLGRAHETLFFRGVDVDLALSLRFGTLEEQFFARVHLTPGASLVRNGLVTLAPIGSGLNPHELQLRVSEAVACFVLERAPMAGSLGRYCELVQPKNRWEQVILPQEQSRLVWEIVSGERTLASRLGEWGYGSLIPRGRGVVLLLSGPPGTGKTAFAHAIASRLGMNVLVVRSSHLVASREPILPVLEDVLRVATLERALVLIDDCEALLSARDARFLAMLEALDSNDALVVLTTNVATEIDFAVNRRIQCRVDFELPPAVLREQIWEVHLPPEAPLSSDIDIPLLAATYEFTGAVIRNTVMVALARMLAQDESTLTMASVREAAETQLAARFDGLAVRGGASGSLDDLVLPEEPRRRLLEIRDACRVHGDVLARWGFGRRLSTGRGLCILFDGPPGTGKTLSAELLAAELRLPLYRIHIPNIVSKWVGETERNIAELFVRARAARALLLFDEADALFGRRSASAQTSNDRYANMEVNLLLQEIERYDGITVLTTNLFGNLDEALQRRIQFRVTFPFPEPVERARIWLALLPPEAPIAADVDADALGTRFELAGGHIKNSVLRAAYRARAGGDVIRQKHLIEAALDECQAQGKIVRKDQGQRPPPRLTVAPPPPPSASPERKPS